jgi:2-methylcitrate dehydratase PrpD
MTASQLSPTVSERLAAWAESTGLDAIPADVREATKLRILDTVGLALAGQTFDIGRSVLASCEGNETGPATVIGGAAGVPAATAALANGVLAEAIEFDDSHNETVVHISTPVVAAALAAGEDEGCSGADLVRAVALASELTCRIAVAQPGAFHPIGFHPTGIFGAFGAAAAASILKGHSASQMVQALGLAGSFASGLLESWSDGSWGKLINPGWAAQAGIWASKLAASDFTGPRTVFEGKFGLFLTHVQNAAKPADFGRTLKGLGEEWESRAISFKPYPNAHVMHGVIDAAHHLLAGGIEVDAIDSIECMVAPYMVDLICEPQVEKKRPPSSAAARISLHHTIAELLSYGRLDVTAYSDRALEDPALQALADRISYTIIPDWTDRSAYPGGVRIRMQDGSMIERIEKANLGSAVKPMTQSNLKEKFRANAALVLDEAQAGQIVRVVCELDRLDHISRLTALCATR